eukprot:3876705-Alexandrium_andersonii.AAC.1
MELSNDAVELGLKALIDWAAPKFQQHSQLTMSSVATAIALETAVPVDFILAAARLFDVWPDGQTRFSLEGAGPDSVVT